MAFTLPNIETSPTFDAQSVVDSTDESCIVAANNGTGVISGCGVVAQGTPNMTVQVGSGTVRVAGAPVGVSSVGSLTIGAASATDRKDIVVVNNAGTVSVVAGTACGTAGWTRSSAGLPPVKPAIPANSVLLAEVYVASTTTSIPNANIVDKTLIINPISSWSGTQSFTGAIQTPALGVNIAPGTTGTAKTANNTLDDGSGNITAGGTLRTTALGVNIAPGSVGTARTAHNTLDDGSGNMTVTGNGSTDTSLTVSTSSGTSGTWANIILSTTTASWYAGTAETWQSGAFFIRTGVASSNSGLSISTAGGVFSQAVGGAIRNTLDDGSGNQTISGIIQSQGIQDPLVWMSL